MQLHNQEVVPSWRYVIVRVSEAATIARIKVISGDTLALLDTTGTLTRKYQARLTLRDASTELVSGEDTGILSPLVGPSACLSSASSPTDCPEYGSLMPIDEIFTRLRSLVGKAFPDPGRDQERNRGAELHRLVCTHLGYRNYQDDG